MLVKGVAHCLTINCSWALLYWLLKLCINQKNFSYTYCMHNIEGTQWSYSPYNGHKKSLKLVGAKIVNLNKDQRCDYEKRTAQARSNREGYSQYCLMHQYSQAAWFLYIEFAFWTYNQCYQLPGSAVWRRVSVIIVCRLQLVKFAFISLWGIIPRKFWSEIECGSDFNSLS